MNDEATGRGKFRILSIDGGGVRGVLPAAYLAEIEKGLPDSRQLCDCFDIIAGTSTGGIIAAALSLGISAQDVLSFYMKDAKEIFTPPNRQGNIFAGLAKRFLGWITRCFSKQDLNTDQLFFAKYAQDPLRQKLTGVLGERILDDARTLLLLTAVDLASGRTIVFKKPEASNTGKYGGFAVVDAVLATTAAPTYFPAHRLSAEEVYADGGLWANNPGLVAYMEALAVRQHRIGTEGNAFGTDDITVLSINTGDAQGPDFRGPFVGYGLIWWMPRLLQVVFHAQAAGTEYFLTDLLGDRLKRVGFTLTEDMRPLDSTSHLKEMAQLGRQTAMAEAEDVLSRFVL